MRVVRWIGAGLGALVILVLLTAVGARFRDGGIAVFPGGPLEAGALYEGPEPDWSFARDVPEMKLQLVDPPESRTVWLLVHDGRLFVVSGYMQSALGRLWKKWPYEAEEDGRAVVRVEGKRYERQLVRIHDREILEALAAEAQRKYGVEITADGVEAGAAWAFELKPRGAGEGTAGG